MTGLKELNRELFEGNTKGYEDYLGERLGFVPYTERFRDNIDPDNLDPKPRYLNGEDVVPDYFVDVEKKVRDHFAEEFGVLPYVDDLEISVAKLPTHYWIFVDENGELVERPVSKVFGMYDPENRRIILDPVLFDEYNDPEKAELFKYMEIPTAERVLGEEFIHYIQDNLGILYHHYMHNSQEAQARIEGSAAGEADRVFGRTGVYTEFKRQYEDEVSRKGRRAAFLEGSIPDLMGMPLYSMN